MVVKEKITFHDVNIKFGLVRLDRESFRVEEGKYYVCGFEFGSFCEKRYVVCVGSNGGLRVVFFGSRDDRFFRLENAVEIFELVYVCCAKCYRKFVDVDSGMFVIHEGFFCKDCLGSYSYFRCADCGYVFLTDCRFSGFSRDICNSCFYDYYHICSVCGSLFRKEGGLVCVGDSDDGDGIIVCGECRNRLGDDGIARELRSKRLYVSKCENVVSYPSRKKSFTLFGVELETIVVDDYRFYDDCFRFFKRVEDNSIESDDSYYCNGVEFVSCPLPFDDRGFSILKDLSSSLRDIADVNSSCGFHVHFNMKKSDRTIENIKKIFLFYHKFEDEFFKMVPKSRRDNKYCKSLKEFFEKEYSYPSFLGENDMNVFLTKFYKFDVSESRRKYFDKRYYWVNLHSIFFRGTLEIRLHSGTIDFWKIMNWIKIHKICLDFIMSHSLHDIMTMTKEDFYNLFDDNLKIYIFERQKKFGG